MSRLWKWIDSYDVPREKKIRGFLVLNCLVYSLAGFFIWLLVHKFAFDTWDWAFCFAGYPGFFCGFIGGYIFLGRQ